MTHPRLKEISDRLEAAQAVAGAWHRYGEAPPLETTFSRLAVLTCAVPLHDHAKADLALLLRIVEVQGKFMEKAGYTHCAPDSESDEYAEGYEQAMLDIRDWVSSLRAQVAEILEGK